MQRITKFPNVPVPINRIKEKNKAKMSGQSFRYINHELAARAAAASAERRKKQDEK